MRDRIVTILGAIPPAIDEVTDGGPVDAVDRFLHSLSRKRAFDEPIIENGPSQTGMGEGDAFFRRRTEDIPESSTGLSKLSC